MRINIYLEGNEKKQLIKLKEKYHISISTIADIIVKIYMMNGAKEGLHQELNEKYIYGRTGSKTSIKPKYENYISDVLIKKPSVVYTNALKMFLKGDMKKYVEQKTYEQSTNKIYQLFQDTYEDDWNGSLLHKLIPKYIKQSPDYYKKILEKER